MFRVCDYEEPERVFGDVAVGESIYTVSARELPPVALSQPYHFAFSRDSGAKKEIQVMTA